MIIKLLTASLTILFFIRGQNTVKWTVTLSVMVQHLIITLFVTSSYHLGDIFTEVLFRKIFLLCSKLNMIGMYTLV